MPAGRPRLYDSPEKMAEAIERYFDEADEKGWPYTVPDLALSLGFTSRGSFWEYTKRPEFSDTLKTASLRIEAQRNRQLLTADGSAAGKIFDLKNNFGWVDKIEQHHTGNVAICQHPEDEDL